MDKSKTVLVTGASKGIGQAVAISLGQSGFDVLIHYGKDKAGAEQTLESIKSADGKARLMSFNVGDREETKAKLTEDMTEFGAYYGIVNNAGIARDTAFPAMTDEDWDQVLNTNLNGFYNVVRPCVMEMVRRRKPGRIVAMTSVSGIAGNRGQVNYSASKAGVIGAVKALSLELAKRKITVNCVAPGLIDTGMISEEVWEHARGLVPMGRMGNVDEVSSLVRFLMSDEASYITRQVISVNGGMI